MTADCENCLAPCCSDLAIRDGDAADGTAFYYPLGLARLHFRPSGADLRLVRTEQIPRSEERAPRFACTAKDQRAGVAFRCTVWQKRPAFCVAFDCSDDAIGASCEWPRPRRGR